MNKAIGDTRVNVQYIFVVKKINIQNSDIQEKTDPTVSIR